MALSKNEIDSNFNDLHKPLNNQQAIEESDRCLYCYDAPCIQACPTSIDIPTFIHQIRSDNVNGAALTILSENIMGGTCARVCPTEILCQEVCVLNTSHQQPVEIGLLQRHAVDSLLSKSNKHPFNKAESTAKSIAVVGAGPAGLSCAHRLATLGHDVSIYEAKAKSGGLNEYGLAAYKMVDDYAQQEVDFILNIGGITVKHEKTLGENLSLQQLTDNYDAVFIGIGLSQTYSLGLDKLQVNIGNDVVVIGAGNTAIDAAVQAKRLGAENVTLVYRRGEQHMSATAFEVDLARKSGVTIKLWSTPIKIKGKSKIKALQFAKTQLKDGKLVTTKEHYKLKTDCLLKAIGQKLDPSVLGEIKTTQGKINIDDNYQTSQALIYAGGDAIKSGEDLTVQAVEDGKQAAIAIDQALRGEKS